MKGFHFHLTDNTKNTTNGKSKISQRDTLLFVASKCCHRHSYAVVVAVTVRSFQRSIVLSSHPSFLIYELFIFTATNKFLVVFLAMLVWPSTSSSLPLPSHSANYHIQRQKTNACEKYWQQTEPFHLCKFRLVYALPRKLTFLFGLRKHSAKSVFYQQSSPKGMRQMRMNACKDFFSCW